MNIKELRTICQASAPDPARESFVGKRLVRFFSIYITALLIKTKLTPNHITTLSVLVFFAGISLFIFNNYILNLAGAFIIFLSLVFDGCDGEVARYKKTGGITGTLYVEPISHDVQYGLMFIPIGLGLFLNGYPWFYLLLAASASINKLLYRLLEIRFWYLTSYKISTEKLEEQKQSHNLMPQYLKLFYWVNKNFFSSTGVFLVILICSVINRIDLYIWFYAIGFALLWILLFGKQILKLGKIN